jgi:acyl dehydratase
MLSFHATRSVQVGIPDRRRETRSKLAPHTGCDMGRMAMPDDLGAIVTTGSEGEHRMRTFESVTDLAAAAGETIGQSDWVTITQNDVNLFADATGDHQWIHVDPERAAAGPFGGTIAHGFMTLSLLPRLQHQMYTVNGIKLAINYGLNKVRFPAPVPVGSRVRAQSSLVSVDDLGNGAVQAIVSTTVEIDGSPKPACVAESIVRYIS